MHVLVQAAGSCKNLCTVTPSILLIKNLKRLPGTMLVVCKCSNQQKSIACHVLNSVLSYISGLCTAAVERWELHEDNTFTLNSEILQCTQ